MGEPPNGHGSAHVGLAINVEPRLWPWLVPMVACLALGGVRPWAVGVLAVVCGLGALRGGRARAGLPEWLLLGVLAMQLLQLVPLPIALLRRLDPGTAEIVAETWAAAGRTLLGHPLSLAPGETAIATAHLVLFGLALLLARREAARGRREALIQGVIVAAAVVAAIVGVHTLFGLEAIYGVVPARGRGISVVVGPFINSNHLAVFCCATLPVVVAWTLGKRVPAARIVGGVVAAALVGIALATVARTALLGLLVGLTAFGALAAAARQVRGRALALALAGLALALGGGTLWTRGRVLRLAEWDVLSETGSRLGLWSIATEVAREHWLFGVGAGAFHSQAWTVRRAPSETASQDVESVLFQTLVSLGIPMTVAIIVGVAVCVAGAARVAWRRTREGDLTAAGALAGLCGLLALSAVTLTTSQPALTILGAWLYGALSPDAHARGRRLGRPVVVALMAGTCALLAWGGPRTLAATDRAFTATEIADPVTVALRHPSDPFGLAWAAEREVHDPAGRGLELLNRSMVLDPYGAEPHRVAVNVLLAAGLSSQARIEARLALSGATRSELAGFVADALALWPRLEDRLLLLPAEPERAVRVARELARLGGPELGTEVWLALGQRTPPVPGALAQGIAGLPGARRAEALALAEEALLVDPEDVGVRLVLARLLAASGQRDRARAALEAVLARDDLDPWHRTDAVLQTARVHDGDPEILRQLLSRPAGDGAAEQAVRAWMQGRVFESEGAVSQALRAYARAARLRPDSAFFQAELIAFRGRATQGP